MHMRIIHIRMHIHIYLYTYITNIYFCNIQILQQTLPPHIFHMLLQELRTRRELQPDKYEWLLDFK